MPGRSRREAEHRASSSRIRPAPPIVALTFRLRGLRVRREARKFNAGGSDSCPIGAPLRFRLSDEDGMKAILMPDRFRSCENRLFLMTFLLLFIAQKPRLWPYFIVFATEYLPAEQHRRTARPCERALSGRRRGR